VTWGLGSYEDVAVQLVPAAEVAVDRLCPMPGEFVVDVGCGTGNAALLAGLRGARVLGVDPTPRLLEIARASGAAAGHDVRFEAGDAASIPVADGAADAVISVFAAIFAPDPVAAVAEMVRVLTPEGRIVLTAWLPGGALGELYGLRRAMLDDAAGAIAPGPAPFAWHDAGALGELFGSHGFAVELAPADLALYGTDVDGFVEAELRTGPLWVEARAILEPVGRWPALRDAAHELYSNANEEPGRFRLTTHYVVATAARDA
jgi:SAM-dependent methyltransferase